MTALEHTLAVALLTALVLLLAAAHRQLQRIAFNEHVDAALALTERGDR